MDSLESNISNSNKIPGSPGCDSFTRPEEISALSKFLGDLRKKQEKNLNLENTLEDIPGKTTGKFHIIESLGEDYIKISSGEQQEITELNKSFVPLDTPVIDLGNGKLPQHLEGLNTRDIDLEDTLEDNKNSIKLDLGKENIELENNIEKLKVDKNKLKLKKDSIKLKVSNKNTSLEDKKVELNDITETSELSNSVEKLTGNLIDPILGDSIVKLDKDQQDTNLDNTIVNLSLENKILELGDEIINLEKTNKNISLGTTKERIIGDIEEISLDNHRDNLLNIDPIDSLDDTVLKLEKKSDLKLDNTQVSLVVNEKTIDLENKIIDINLPSDLNNLEDEVIQLNNIEPIDNLENELIKLREIDTLKELRENLIELSNISKQDELEGKIIKLDDTKTINELGNNIEKIKNINSINSLSDNIEKIENINPIDSLSDNIEKIENINPIDSLSDNIEKIENINPIDSLSDNVEKIENINSIKDLDSEVIKLNNVNDISELGDFIDLLGEDIPSDLKHEYYDNTNSSKLKYSDKDKLVINTNIPSDSIPRLGTDLHNWFDNRTDNGNIVSNESKLGEYKEKLGHTYLKKDGQLYGGGVIGDYFQDALTELSKNKYYKLKDEISTEDLPIINQTDGNYAWFDNREESDISQLPYGSSVIGAKTFNSDIEELSISPSDLPLNNQGEGNYFWFDNRIESSEEELPYGSFIINAKTFTYDVGNTNGIPLSDLPLDNQMDGNYRWYDNRTDDSGNPIGNDYELGSYTDIEALGQAYSRIDNQTVVIGSILALQEISDNSKNKYYKLDNNIPISELPPVNRENSNNNSYRYHQLKDLLNAEEIDLYNAIMDFNLRDGNYKKENLIIPNASLGKSGENSPYLNLSLEDEDQNEDIISSEWLSFIKALTTTYLNPDNYSGESAYTEVYDKLSTYADSIKYFIGANRDIKSKLFKTLDNPNNIPEEVPRIDQSSYRWFDNTVDESGNPTSNVKLGSYIKHGPAYELPSKAFTLDKDYHHNNYIRLGAEWTVDQIFYEAFKEDNFEVKTPILKEARRQLLLETLMSLIKLRDYSEKILKANRDRLPGEEIPYLSKALRSDFSVKEVLRNTLEFTLTETQNPINRPSKKEKTEEWTSANNRPTESKETADGKGKINFKKAYLLSDNNNNNNKSLSEGINTTLLELAGNSDITSIGSVEDFFNVLKNSPYFTTSNKITTTEWGYKVMTLDSNIHWEIIFEPYVGDLNNWYTFLPLVEEINVRNEKLHGIKTSYNHWIPINSFELQKEKLNSKALGLFDGEIVFPVSMEYTNEFRMTIVDDQYKSWRTYFERCAQASVFSSTPNIAVKSYYTEDMDTDYENHSYIYSNNEVLDWNRMNRVETTAQYPTDVLDQGFYEKKSLISEPKLEPIVIDKKYHLVAPYKNITFRCKILVMTPQLSTINMYDLLLVLKEMSEERSGEIDSSGSDLTLSFSIVGENPQDNFTDNTKFNFSTESQKKQPTKREKELAASKGRWLRAANEISNAALGIL